MDIQVSTIYGDVMLKLCYNSKTSEEFYIVCDCLDICLGELYNLPEYRDDDPDVDITLYQNAVENAIDNNDIAMPTIIEDNVYVVTVVRTLNKSINIDTGVFKQKEYALAYKEKLVSEFMEHMVGCGCKYNIIDSDNTCDCKSSEDDFRMKIVIEYKPIR